MVPTVINGSRALWPPGGLDLRPGTVDVIFCEPLSVNPHLSKKAAREDLLGKVHAAIAEQLRGDVPVTAPVVSPALVPTSAPEHPTT